MYQVNENPVAFPGRQLKDPQRINFLISVGMQPFLHGNPACSEDVIYTIYICIYILVCVFEKNHKLNCWLLQIAMFELLISRPEMSSTECLILTTTTLAVLLEALFKSYHWGRKKTNQPTQTLL